MPRSHTAPARSLPDKPSFAELRKQAKELLKSYLAGEDAAVAEVISSGFRSNRRKGTTND
ncbi:MAG: hypothetical protein ACM3U2_14985 [Deltaproteobacteria bacterium]